MRHELEHEPGIVLLKERYMDLAAQREILAKLARGIFSAFSEHSFVPYEIIDAACPPTGHYFTINTGIVVQPESEWEVRTDLLLFRRGDLIDEQVADINRFFVCSDDLFEECDSLARKGVFKHLAGLFQEAQSPTLFIESRFAGEAPFERQLLHESITAIFLDTEGPVCECAFNARKTLLMPDPRGAVALTVPEDKLYMFPSATLVPPGTDLTKIASKNNRKATGLPESGEASSN